MHFAHYRTSAGTAGRAEEIMLDRDAARDEGVDFTLDIYPYPTGATVPVTFLPGRMQEGGPDEILERLQDPVMRKYAVGHLESSRMAALDSMILSYVDGMPELEGMSLPDVARDRRVSPGEALCLLFVETGLKVGYWGAPPDSVALWRQVDRDSMALLARPDYMVCSDITPAGGLPHPRSYGAYPRFLGRLRRRLGGLSLEAMVHRMTDRPARRFGIARRGRIEKGCYADLVVFDPDRVIDTATYDDPRRYPMGIPWVLVNGRLAVDGEQCTGVMAGPRRAVAQPSGKASKARQDSRR